MPIHSQWGKLVGSGEQVRHQEVQAVMGLPSTAVATPAGVLNSNDINDSI
jgi:hypothetical protein